MQKPFLTQSALFVSAAAPDRPAPHALDDAESLPGRSRFRRLELDGRVANATPVEAARWVRVKGKDGRRVRDAEAGHHVKRAGRTRMKSARGYPVHAGEVRCGTGLSERRRTGPGRGDRPSRRRPATRVGGPAERISREPQPNPARQLGSGLNRRVVTPNALPTWPNRRPEIQSRQFNPYAEIS